jgi:dUTP pyrophosphatase
MKLRIQKTREVKTPTRSHPYDAGLDFYIPSDIGWDTFAVQPNVSIVIPTGIKADIPEGFAFMCFERSSMAKDGLIIGARVVDAEYQGEIHMHVMNVGNKAIYLKPGQKLCQFVLMPIMATEVVEIVNRPLYDEVTDRGEGKFGSTGTGLPPRTNYKWDMEQAIDNQKGKMPDQFPTLDEELPKKKSYPKRKGPVAADEEME